MFTFLLVLLMPCVIADPLRIPVNRLIAELSAETMTTYLIDAMPIGIWTEVDASAYAVHCENIWTCLCYETSDKFVPTSKSCGRDAYVCFSSAVKGWSPLHKLIPELPPVPKIFMISSAQGGKTVEFRHPSPTSSSNADYAFQSFYIDDVLGWAIDGRRYYIPPSYVTPRLTVQPLKIYKKYRSGGKKPERAFRARFMKECAKVPSLRVKNVIGGPIYDYPNNHPLYSYDSTKFP